ncbi:aryl-sulfate sulfotransferase [Flavobacterium sp.]|uniref:aryl-sulfate sulfotransferase n=1 Tax=Flavobacterium sp. TaxID=239 RepID=UPI0039E4F24E
MKANYLLLLLIAAPFTILNAQTVGLNQHDPQSLDDGYVLFAPLSSTTTYLIDKCGRQVKNWSSAYTPGCSTYILPDGTLLRTGKANNPIFTAGGTGGIIEKIDWDGNVIWTYTVSDATKCQHHDVKAMPNGNILLIAWDSRPQAEAIAAGRDPNAVPENLWSEQILEIQPVGATGGNVVWEWHLWDHLVQDFDDTKSNYGSVIDNPQLVNINYNAWPQSDWIHLNSIDYNPVLDQIVLSSFSCSEIWIIDHSTSTAEAASHSGGNSGKGGDLLYRYGNPAVYNGSTAGTVLFNGQHNAHWIQNGLPFANQIIIHNNGNGRIGGNYSSIEIINPPSDGFTYNMTLPIAPAASSWSYNNGNPDNYYAPFISGAEQLPNGNVLICNGPAGIFFEVSTSGETVWKYTNPVNGSGVVTQGETPIDTFTFRCSYYPFDYSGFDGHTLTAGNIIENANIISENCTLNLKVADYTADAGVSVYPNPANDILNINWPNPPANGTISLTNSLGQTVYAARMNSSPFSIDTNAFATGLYYLKISADGSQFDKKIIIE